MKKDKQTIVAVALTIILICLCVYRGYNYINANLKNDEIVNNDKESNSNNNNSEDKENDDKENNNQNNDNNNKENEEIAIFFYQKGNELLYLNPNEASKKEEYDKNYTYLSKYICENEMCEVLTSSGQAGAGKINYNIASLGVFIREAMEEFCFFNFKSNKKIYTYNVYPYVACNNIDGSGTILYHENNKVAIIGNNGQIISSYYDDIMGGNFGIYDLNFSNKYGISQYKNNSKEGIISLTTGKEITEAIYDEVLIYHDNIILKQNDLYYVADENGNIKSNGYKNILDATEKVIIIEENGLIDILDYNGISKISEKIDARGQTKAIRRPCGGPAAAPLMKIEVNNGNIKIFIQDNDGIFTYIYNQETETLSIDTKIN